MTDTALSRKVWFRKLPPEFKCTWRFLLDECDDAGCWSIDSESIKFHVGAAIDLDDFIREVNSEGEVRIVRLGKDKLFLVGFIKFQYGKLSEACKPHKRPIQRLHELGLFEPYLKGFPKGFETLQYNTIQDSTIQDNTESAQASQNVDNSSNVTWANAATLEDCIRNAIYDGDEAELEKLVATLPKAKRTHYRLLWNEQQTLRKKGVA